MNADETQPLLSVIIPVYNERRTIVDVLEKVRAVQLSMRREVIVVNDGSTDGTRELIHSANDGLLVEHHSAINLGKGAAVRIGIELAHGDYLLIQDADLELDPNEYPLLLAPLVSGEADVVYGSRFLRRQGRGGSFLARLANRVIVLTANLLYGARLTDVETAYKVFRRDVIKPIRLRCVGFEFEPEVTGKLLHLGYRITEVPISYHARTTEEGKKIRWQDGIHALYVLLKCRFMRREEILRQDGPWAAAPVLGRAPAALRRRAGPVNRD